jgi:hypothetical protein
MKLGLLNRIDRGNLAKAGGDIPKWIDPFLETLNQFIEKVGLSLQNRLTFNDNFLSKEVEREFQHDVELEINPSLQAGQSLRVRGIVPMSTGTVFIVGFKWAYKSNGNVGVTIKLDGATTATIRLQLFY